MDKKTKEKILKTLENRRIELENRLFAAADNGLENVTDDTNPRLDEIELVISIIREEKFDKK